MSVKQTLERLARDRQLRLELWSPVLIRGVPGVVSVLLSPFSFSLFFSSGNQGGKSGSEQRAVTRSSAIPLNPPTPCRIYRLSAESQPLLCHALILQTSVTDDSVAEETGRLW